jgi:hypothetical protein
MRPFKIRCSAIGSIMAYPEKNEVPKGAITYLHTWVKEQLYDRTRFFTSKYTEKGINVEEDAINLASDYFGWGFVTKNEKHYENDFLTGTPDLVLAGLVPDIKSSWDCFSFPLFDTKVDSDYEWQLQGYMALTGKENAAVIYCLMDAPEELVEREARNLSYKAGYSEVEVEFYEQVKLSMTYSNLPIELRIRRFDVQRDEKKIQQINDRVEKCREHIKTLPLSSFKKQILKAA